MNAPLWVVVPVMLLVAIATGADVRTRKIPNVLVGPALALALVAHAALGGWTGFTGSLAGLVVAGGLLLPGHLARWMGAGDVKLMAAVGAWLGWPLALTAVLAALVAGGLVSLVVALRKRVLVRTLHGAAAIGFWSFTAPAGAAGPAPSGSGVRFPFAVAAAAGVLFTLMVRS